MNTGSLTEAYRDEIRVITDFFLLGKSSFHLSTQIREAVAESPASASRISFPSVPLFLRGFAKLVKPFGCDVGAVLPEDGLVEAELDELFRVAQFLEGGIREQRRKVNLQRLAGTERAEQRVVAQVLYICNCQ